jgi:hypothetical protein
MDPIAANAVEQNPIMTQGQVGVAMLKKTIDIMAQEGTDMVRLLSQQTGVGQQMDVQA